MTQPYPHRFPGLTCAAIQAELAREGEQRRPFYARKVAKGEMAEADARHQLALIAAWRADFARIETALAPLAHGQPALNPSSIDPPHFAQPNGEVAAGTADGGVLTWRERHDGLLRELGLRAHLYPRWIAKGELTQEQAAHRVACLEALLALYDDGLDWPADPTQRAALYDEVMARRAGQDQQKELEL